MRSIHKYVNAGKIICGLLFFLLTLLASTGARAQAGAGMKLGSNYAAYEDSIKKSNYKWVFPVWGKRLSKKGFDLQYPFGIMVNSFTGSQKIVISDLKVGFNSLAPVPLDFVKFGTVKAVAQSVSLRPDIWIFPFMDIYGIGGPIWTKTEVQVVEPFTFNTSASFHGYTVGIGTTLAGGYHGIITIIDLNHTWTTLNKIQGSVQATMFTPRVGFNYLFRDRPGKNVAIWVGAPGTFVNHGTQGSLDIGQITGNAARSDLENIINGSAPWYQPLSPAQKLVVKDIAQKMLDKLNGVTPVEGVISYSLNKRPQATWSMCAGGQFQLNHHWQFRTEANFFGGRSSVLLSGNYRWRW